MKSVRNLQKERALNKETALRVLNIERFENKTELKKIYRGLMHRVHPDSLMNNPSDYPYTAQEINEAYEVLYKSGSSPVKAGPGGNKKSSWNAPVNNNAYGNRKIFDEVIDSDGEVIGIIEIACGKYVLSQDEEFHLFMKSLYTLSKELLDNIDTKLNRLQRKDYEAFQAKLVYLLAGQFVDSVSMLLSMGLDIENNENDDVFYVPAMLETDMFFSLKNRRLYPESFKNQRLYVCDESKNTLGYISFKDDGLSMAMALLFERKDVLVKMELQDKQQKQKNRNGKISRNVDLWIKVPIESEETSVGDSNEKIRELLHAY